MGDFAFFFFFFFFCQTGYDTRLPDTNYSILFYLFSFFFFSSEPGYDTRYLLSYSFFFFLPYLFSSSYLNPFFTSLLLYFTLLYLTLPLFFYFFYHFFLTSFLFLIRYDIDRGLDGLLDFILLDYIDLLSFIL
ncbi:hypothetical protein BZA77DRAFT_112752 [Pyronema omphalodes]|nr:hypothetical protein BZA77DRAFT_112752 [Pyronema omphalodes]